MSNFPSHLLVVLSSLLLPGVALAGHPLGEPIERAAAVHLSQGGLDHAGDALEKFVPTTFPVSNLSGEVYCSGDDALPLTYDVGDFALQISADDVQIVPSEGRLDLWLYGTLGSTSSTLSVTGNCTVLTGLAEVCTLALPTTALSAHLGLAISQVDGVFTATADDLSISISPINNPLSGCTLASAIGTLLGQNPEFFNDLLLSYVEPELPALLPTIEEALTEALNSLQLETELALGDATLGIQVAPSRLELGDDGVILGMSATVDGVVSDCVDAGDGSDFSGAAWPEFGETAPGSALKYDAGVVIGQDLLDHVLYAVWASGLLCQQLSDLSGAAITTSLVGTLLGLTEEFDALFPEDMPATLVVDPKNPPYAIFGEDDPPVSAAVDGLGLSMVTTLDDRQLRLFHLDVDARIGLSVTVTTEEVGLSPVIAGENITFHETSNEFLPQGFSQNLKDLLPTILDMFGASALSFSYTLPDLMGIGIGATYWIPTEDGEWQGLYALLDSSGVVPLEIGGCDASGVGCDGSGGGVDLGDLGCSEDGSGCGGSGCDDSGCEGGSSCSVQRAGDVRLPARPLFVSGLLLLAMLRRRSRSSS